METCLLYSIVVQVDKAAKDLNFYQLCTISQSQTEKVKTTCSFWTLPTARQRQLQSQPSTSVLTFNIRTGAFLQQHFHATRRVRLGRHVDGRQTGDIVRLVDRRRRSSQQLPADQRRGADNGVQVATEVEDLQDGRRSRRLECIIIVAVEECLFDDVDELIFVVLED